MHARRLFLWICLLMSPLLALTGLGAGESVRETGLFLNTRARLGGEKAFVFTPREDGEYVLCALPLESDAVCQVRWGEETTEGTLPMSISMEADEEYHIRITGGEGAFEIMRSAHGRAFATPITLTENNLRYTKTVTSPRDVHWYCFTAPRSGLYTFRTETAAELPLDTVGYLLDGEGNQLAYCDDILPRSDPNFRMFHEMEAGEQVYIRVSAFSNDTGLYRLVVAMPQGDETAPESITLSEDRWEMDVGESRELTPVLSPENAYRDLVYSTSDPMVARVSPEGTVTAVGAGDARITVSGYGDVAAVCNIHVRPIQATALTLDKTELTLSVENTALLTAVFTPANTSDQTLQYTSSDPAVASVDDQGRITALQEGECTVTAASVHGLTASVRITVTPRSAVYRALVVSEYRYEDGRTRTGAVNTAQGMTQMLENNGYTVTFLLDNTYEELSQGVEEAFSGARPGDISLLYINGHGKTENGISYFELHDGTRITPQGLYRLMHQVPGQIVLLLDFCQSGAFLSTEDAPSPLENSRFLVLTSADAGQDSYRLGDGKDSSEAGMSTVFARAVSEGAGWDLMRDRTTLKKADLDQDGRITFAEIYDYSAQRVASYLSGTGASQTPQASHPQSDLVLFPDLSE